jgi:hypothetical protein
MRRTKIARQVLTVLEYATVDRFDRGDLRRLVVRAEQIARGRRSHVLGVRHLVTAGFKLGYLEELLGPGGQAPPEARPVTAEVVAPGPGQSDEMAEWGSGSCGPSDEPGGQE